MNTNNYAQVTGTYGNIYDYNYDASDIDSMLLRVICNDYVAG